MLKAWSLRAPVTENEVHALICQIEQAFRGGYYVSALQETALVDLKRAREELATRLAVVE